MFSDKFTLLFYKMDDDYDPTAVVSKKKNKKKRSKFAQAVTSSKPTFDPS